MPKIIENLESKLIEEAFHQIRDVGYSATTIRSIAKACGVGVGTGDEQGAGGKAQLLRFGAGLHSEHQGAGAAMTVYH